ncbi:MAG TPA: zinc finger domain-containing protein, partial [Gammaproteobacteria bacterium]
DHLEMARQTGTIGGSLDAEVTLYAVFDGDTDRARHAEFAALGDELRFALITSAAALQALDAGAPLPEGAVELAWGGSAGEALRWGIRVVRSPAAKCVRCWHHRGDVGSDPGHPELCARCVQNAFGAGETRVHA